MRAKWISFDQTKWTLIGRNMDSLSNSLNPQVEQSQDVCGYTYLEHKGYQPQADIEYKCNDTDDIYENIVDIVNGLAKDEATCGAYMIDATLNKEVKDGDTETLTGKGYKVPVVIIPSEDGGDTGSWTITFSAYENGARVAGTVSVANGAPTFTADNG